jgi:hypothetical protein
MNSKKVLFNILSLGTATLIVSTVLVSCSDQTPKTDYRSGQTTRTADVSCGTVAECAQKAVEAAQAAQQAADNTSKTVASLTLQIQGLQQQLQDSKAITAALKPAMYFQKSYAEMSTFHPSCNNPTPGNAGQIECASAIRRFCVGQGFAGGFPQEGSNTELGFICVK